MKRYECNECGEKFDSEEEYLICPTCECADMEEITDEDEDDEE